MANLKEIRNRISSVSSTMQITSAMKMVSAAKLKKAQDAITAMRPYANKLTELLQTLSATLEGDSGSKFAEQRTVNKVLLVAITSNKGLCGGFNANIIKQAKNLVENVYQGKQVDFITIGKKGNDIISKENNIIQNSSSVFDDLTFDNVAVIAEKLMELYLEGAYDKIELVYNKFKNAASQDIMTEQFLPIVPLENDSSVQLDYIFEPSKIEIIEALIPKSLKTHCIKQ
jgi:F-type H+-transporting ATPase subunit gamma